MDNLFFQLASVLTLASLLGLLIIRLRLPLVVAYLLAGVTIAVLFPDQLTRLEIFTYLPELGIALILFLVGIELDLRKLKSIGFPIITASLGQLFITTIAGFAMAGYLGFSQIESLFIGLGLAFSSTIVVIRALLEKREIASLHGKLSIGILLVEDIVAILVLMAISVGSAFFVSGLHTSIPLVLLVLKAVGLFFITFLFSRFILEKIFDLVAKSVELLFLTAITWCFLLITLTVWSGFTVIIGAFLAGIAIASSPYHLQIAGKVKPLRDFFVSLFFIYLGTQARLEDFIANWPAILAFSSYALIFKPLLFVLILGSFGFRKNTFFRTALSLGQISEFSLELLLVGLYVGIISQSTMSVMAAVAVLSIVISSLTIYYSNQLYRLFSPFLNFFQQSKKTHLFEKNIEKELDEHIVIIGAHRIGRPIIDFLHSSHTPFVVMDFNPHVVQELREKGIHVIYGDMNDPEILLSLQLEKAKLIISTTQDTNDNEYLLSELKRRRLKTTVVVRAIDPDDAKSLKKMGADYVILPEKVSGDFMVKQLKKNWPRIEFEL